MIHFEGVEEFDHTPADVYAKLADAHWLTQSLPDAEVSVCTPDHAEWKVKPKFAFMGGMLDTTADILQRVPNELVRIQLISKGVGSNSTMMVGLHFHLKEGGGAKVKWKGEFTELGGLLKIVPQPFLQTAAQKVIQELWTGVHAKMK